MVVIVVVIFEGDFLILKFYHNGLVYHCRGGGLLSNLRLVKRALVVTVRAIAVVLVPGSSGSFHLRSWHLRTLRSFIEGLINVLEEP